jgi:hypothetical protein
MILHGQLCGNVGRRRIKITKGRIGYSMRPFSFSSTSAFLRNIFFTSSSLFEIRDPFLRAFCRFDCIRGEALES